jgi:hypothetical protein
MLETDARRIVAALEERINAGDAIGQGVKATVETDRTAPDVTAPGAGRPTFIRYHIQIDDGMRVAKLDLDQAAMLLDEIEPGWDLERLFDAIRSHGVPVQEAS